MTVDLESRARSAAAAVHDAVGASRLRLLEDGIPALRRESRWATRPTWAAVAGAATALLVLFGVFTVRDALFAPATPPPGTIAVTLPSSTTTVTTTASTADPVAITPPAETSSTTSTTTTTTVDLLPPLLTITEPTDGEVFAEKVITFRGITEPGATVAAGPYEADVDTEGNWAIVLVLRPGDNVARFTATDGAGNQTEATVTVRYEPPAVTTTTTKPVADPAPFIANYTWGTCPLDPPYDEYYGTGEPGTKVTVSSKYGGGVTKVAADGSWYVKVFFPEAPLDTPFPVTIEDSLGRGQVFEFTFVSG